jgi:hypothetical protein
MGSRKDNGKPKMAGWFTDVEYAMEDWRDYDEAKKRWYKRTRGNDLLLCGFGEKTVVIGYEGKLWALHDLVGMLDPRRYNSDDASWFADLRAPKVLLRVFRKDDRLDYSFEAFVLEKIKGRKKTFVYFGMLENVNHLLIRLQRWIRRVLLRERARLVLLMGLHPRLGCVLLGGLGHEIINGVLMRVGFEA